MAVEKFKNTPELVTWDGPFNIDADGAPNAYGPSSKPGLDYLANAGGPGNWYGILVNAKGEPLVQGPNDPCPGMYISPTSLVDKGYAAHDPRRYVDSTSIPYLACAKDLLQGGVKLGDVGFAYNRATGLWAAGVVADAGPRGKYGEGSIAMAKAIGIKNISPKNGGAGSGIVVVIFKGTSLGWPRVPAEINDQVQVLVAKAGGITAFL
jgi:hypothetical protein